MRALISVSDKSGVVELAKALADKGIEIISTGGTYSLLHQQGIPVEKIENITGHPEMLNGRVKTLHPKIHGGLLALRNNMSHMQDLGNHNIKPIDIVVVNLYPFKEAIKNSPDDIQNALENIDIGGVTLLRAAAKNHNSVAVVTDPKDYPLIIRELSSGISLSTKQKLAVKAFNITSEYDSAINDYLSKKLTGKETLRLNYSNGQSLRYGENWHQTAEFFRSNTNEPCIANFQQLHGKQLSFNNFVDGDGALEVVKDLIHKNAVAVVKHTNPCGLATGKTLRLALENAWAGDTVSAFGSVIAFSREVDLDTASFLKGRFVEMVIAPSYSGDALDYLRKKSKNLRILKIDGLENYQTKNHNNPVYKHITGGMLRQSRDNETLKEWKVVTKRDFPEEKRPLAEFTTIASKHTKSNAVILGIEYEPSQYKVLGMGAGQPNRVDSLRKLAKTKADENLKAWYEQEQLIIPFGEFKEKKLRECILVSDAFFPFDDTVRFAAENNIPYIVQPGGSIRDEEVINACDELNISMVFTGMRHFKH